MFDKESCQVANERRQSAKNNCQKYFMNISVAEKDYCTRQIAI